MKKKFNYLKISFSQIIYDRVFLLILIMKVNHELNTIDKILQEAYEKQLEISLLASQESQALRNKLVA